MLTIRRAQLAAMERHLRRAFEELMVGHLREHFFDDCLLLGDDGLRNRIHDGIRRAAAWKISVERDVCAYLDLMFLFGDEFDSDPALPWARRILADSAADDRVERLRAAAAEHLEHGS
jgi:hypothetical protein